MEHPDNYKEAFDEMCELFTTLQKKYKDCRNELCLRQLPREASWRV